MPFVTGLVLAAGAARRLGEPKQLLPFREGTLLGATLDTARNCRFDQLVVTLGRAAADIERTVNLLNVDVVRNRQFASGCSSSIAAALPQVSPKADGIVLLLGDQPDVDPTVVAELIDIAQQSPIGICRYRNGAGHPFWLGRAIFDQLATLHGDKGVWKLIDTAGPDLISLNVEGEVPLDVDTWDDYQHLLTRESQRHNSMH